MTLTTALWLVIVSAIIGMDAAAEEWQMHRPIIAATLVGVVLGDVQQGVMVGAALEMVALGWMTIGAAVPPDPGLASAVAVIMVIIGKQNIGTAIGLAIPVAVAGQILLLVQRTTTDVAIMHWAEEQVGKGNAKAITIAHFLTGIPSTLRMAVPTLLAAYFANTTYVQAVFNSIPNVITSGLQIAAGFLVVVGYAMIMQLLDSRALLPYFFIGFTVMTFTNTTLVGLAILGTSFAILYYMQIKDDDKTGSRSKRTRVFGG